MRPAAILVGTLVLAAAVLVATGAYRSSPVTTAESDVSTTPAGKPDSTIGSLVIGKQIGKRAAGLYVTPSSSSTASLRILLLEPDTNRSRGLSVTFEQKGLPMVPAEPCGRGCYRATRTLHTGRPVTVLVRDRAGRTTSARFEVPATWHPAAQLVARLTAAFRRLRSVAYDERLSTGLGQAVETRWLMEAPDRLSYAIRSGARGIVIGDRRWDKSAGGPWIASDTTRLRLPEPPWTGITARASLVGATRIAQRPTSVVVFETPGRQPIWFTVWIDRETSLPVRLRMTTSAHFMTQNFISFDDAPRITAPRT
jgi:hypothetical protein